MLRVGVLISGGGSNLQAIMDAKEHGDLDLMELVTVVSSSAKAYGLERAHHHGIQTAVIRPKAYETSEAFGQALLTHFQEKQVDLVVLAGYLVILPENFVKAYANQIINIHPSLIPAFCGDGFYGLKVHEAALNRGVKLVGATVHYVDTGTDTGPIILQKAVAVEPGDTPETLQKRVMEEAEWQILPKAIGLIAKGRIQIKGSVTEIL